MAVFDPKSRYIQHATTYETTDLRGRRVRAVGPAMPPVWPNLGDHLLKEHHRLDHLSAHYLSDAFGFWRLAEHNGAILPDSVLRRRSLRVPRTQ